MRLMPCRYHRNNEKISQLPMAAFLLELVLVLLAFDMAPALPHSHKPYSCSCASPTPVALSSKLTQAWQGVAETASLTRYSLYTARQQEVTASTVDACSALPAVPVGGRCGAAVGICAQVGGLPAGCCRKHRQHG